MLRAEYFKLQLKIFEMLLWKKKKGNRNLKTDFYLRKVNRDYS